MRSSPNDNHSDAAGDRAQRDAELYDGEKETAHPFELIGRGPAHPRLSHYRPCSYGHALGSGENKDRDGGIAERQQAYRGDREHQEGGAETFA